MPVKTKKKGRKQKTIWGSLSKDEYIDWEFVHALQRRDLLGLAQQSPKPVSFKGQ